MKKFMDIQNLIEGNDGFKSSNALGFEVGDIIQITEKVDGSNASIQYADGKIHAFSRRLELNIHNTLDGFYDFAQELNAEVFAPYPNFVIFGEWLRKNKIIYNQESYHQFYMYDIYDIENEKWLAQNEVKHYAQIFGCTYIHELYYGPFISWEHCKSFCHTPAYGDCQEGVVVKNQTKLNNLDSKLPFYLKIVNKEFKETKVQKPQKSEEELNAQKQAIELTKTIVTERRVEKMIYALRDDGILPEKIGPQDMKLVAQNLPKRVYEDCIKEENEIVKVINAIGVQPFSKLCGSCVMNIAKQMICS